MVKTLTRYAFLSIIAFIAYGAVEGQCASPSAPATVTALPQTQTALPTLVPAPADQGGVDDVVLPAKSAASISGKATWAEGYPRLLNDFKTIETELVKAGLKPAGRPLTLFTQTDDAGFQYEAMIPIDHQPEGVQGLPQNIHFRMTPEGKALRFVHKGPYDDIDGTYEAVTAYLDAKSITVKDSFIEEYVTDTPTAADPTLEINIFVQEQ